MVILDTNIIVDHLRLREGNEDSQLIAIVKKNPKESLAISMITVQELYEGKSTKDSQKEQFLLEQVVEG